MTIICSGNKGVQYVQKTGVQYVQKIEKKGGGALTSKRGACRKTENVAKKGNWKG